MNRFSLVFLTVCLGFLSFTAPAMAQEKNPVKITKTQKSLQLGLALKQYKYVEPGYVEHSGLLYGFWGEWLWNSSLGKGRTTGEMVFGTINYDGALCNLSNICDPYKATTKDIIAKIATRLEYSIFPSTSIFSGLGFRYLYDKGEGIGFYQRTGTWLFLPVGANFNFDTGIGKWLLDFQYDFIFYGNFKSNLSEVDSSFSDLSHKQSGYGLTVSTGVQLESYTISAFYELWDLNESDTVESSGYYFVEPKNSSTAFGLKLGYKF